MICQGLAYGIRNTLMKGCAKAFRNPFGNPSLQGHTISGSGRRCSYRQSRIHQLTCLGNAVVPQVVEVIGKAIMKEATL